MHKLLFFVFCISCDLESDKRIILDSSQELIIRHSDSFMRDDIYIPRCGDDICDPLARENWYTCWHDCGILLKDNPEYIFDPGFIDPM